MNKLEMAHDYLLKLMETNPKLNAKQATEFVWEMVDAMQAEADKRVKQKAISDAESSNVFFEKLTDSRSLTKDENGNCLHFHREFGHKKCMDCGASLEEWQPDWSQAPDGYDWWAMDKDGFSAWHKSKPNTQSGIYFWIRLPTVIKAPSFNYTGNWQDSLRKRPQ